MTRSLHSLKHEHRIIERVLRALDGICARLEWGQHVPPAVLSQIVDFIGAFANHYHHGKEEDYLFPILRRHGLAHGGGPLGAIEREHRIESELTKEMIYAIEGYRDLDPAARELFVDAARRYSSHLLTHMDKEEAILFRLADEIIDDQDKAALSEGFTQASVNLGAGAREKYDEVASELEREWAL